jgi:hypothetical protein
MPPNKRHTVKNGKPVNFLRQITKKWKLGRKKDLKPEYSPRIEECILSWTLNSTQCRPNIQQADPPKYVRSDEKLNAESCVHVQRWVILSPVLSLYEFLLETRPTNTTATLPSLQSVLSNISQDLAQKQPSPERNPADSFMIRKFSNRATSDSWSKSNLAAKGLYSTVQVFITNTHSWRQDDDDYTAMILPCFQLYQSTHEWAKLCFVYVWQTAFINKLLICTANK